MTFRNRFLLRVDELLPRATLLDITSGSTLVA